MIIQTVTPHAAKRQEQKRRMYMNTHTRSRFLAWLLLVAMVLTMLPTAAFAAEAATYTKITTM